MNFALRRPWWLLIPPAWSHALAPFGVSFVSRLYGRPQIPRWKSTKLMGLEFPNPLGLAGGFDKNGTLIAHLFRLGFGFVEVGTVTPEPQDGNPGKVLDRVDSHQALWNRLGFPSRGAKFVVEQVRRFRTQHGDSKVIFLNVGKNRWTPNERAHEDYLKVIEPFNPLVDGFVLNLSSPNTPGLRSLQEEHFLNRLIPAVKGVTQKPFGFKLSPDLEVNRFADLVHFLIESQVSFVILTNTTTYRPKGLEFLPQAGGLSGKPLAHLAEHFLETAHQIRCSRRSSLVLVSVGGVISARDVERRLQLGADLVQVYTALVYQGFLFPQRVAQYMLSSYGQSINS